MSGVSDDTPLDDRGFVARDGACPRCGHNLRGLQPSARCGECGFSVERALKIWKSEAYWTSWRRVSFFLIIAFVVVFAGANVLIVGPPDLRPADLMPHEAARAFKSFWLLSIPFCILLFVALARMRRVPMPLWIIAGVALLVSLLGAAANHVIEILIIMSV